MDWALIDEVHAGYLHLHDILRWNENRHRLAEARKGEELVLKHLDQFFPLCDVPAWDKVAAQVLTLSRQWDAGLKGTRYVVALMDFHCPGARDTIKMPAMFAQAASLSNVFGHANTCLLAWMPSLPKDNSVSTVDDDEQLIRSLLSKAGF